MGDYADGKPYGGHPGHRLIVQADEGISETMLSDTPRSDAALRWQEQNPDADAVVNYGFAQGLERELALEKREYNEAMEGRIRDLSVYADQQHEALKAIRDFGSGVRSERVAPLQHAVRWMVAKASEALAKNTSSVGTPRDGVTAGETAPLSSHAIVNTIPEGWKPLVAEIIAEYDAITQNAPPHDKEWDYVMRASDWRIISRVLKGTLEASEDELPATGEYEQRPGDDLVKNLRAALLDTAPNRPLGGDLFCWCAMPWRAGLRQHQHSPTCQKVRGIVYRPDVLAYHDELDQSHAQGGTTERPFAHDPANPGINKGNEGPRF